MSGHAASRAVVALVACAGALVGCAPRGPRLAPRAALVPLTVEQDARLPRLAITAGGRTRLVHLRAFGDSSRPVLLVLHGSLSDHRSLLPLAALADRYRVVLWDQRGNGLSERVTRGEYTFDSVVEEIDAVARHFSPDRPVTLVGHSFGAMYSALYMSRRPHRVREAALLEPGGLNGVMGATFAQVITVRFFEPNTTRTWWQNAVLTGDDHAALDQKALLVLGNGRQTNYSCDPERPSRIPVWRPGAYVEYLRGTLMGDGLGRFRYDFAAGLDTVRRPVLLLAGGCSALGGAFQTRWHLPLFADVRVVELDGVGHRLVSEAPERVLAALRAFLAEYR